MNGAFPVNLIVRESVEPEQTCTVSEVSCAVGEGNTFKVACPVAVPGHPPLSVILIRETVEVDVRLRENR